MWHLDMLSPARIRRARSVLTTSYPRTPVALSMVRMVATGYNG